VLLSPFLSFPLFSLAQASTPVHHMQHKALCMQPHSFCVCASPTFSQSQSLRMHNWFHTNNISQILPSSPPLRTVKLETSLLLSILLVLLQTSGTRTKYTGMIWCCNMTMRSKVFQSSSSGLRCKPSAAAVAVPAGAEVESSGCWRGATANFALDPIESSERVNV
jgi:hypothetical protein